MVEHNIKVTIKEYYNKFIIILLILFFILKDLFTEDKHFYDKETDKIIKKGKLKWNLLLQYLYS